MGPDVVKHTESTSEYLTTGDDGRILAHEDGRWVGAGATKLGLGSTLSVCDLRCLLEGKDPHLGNRLRQRRTDVPGWLLHFAVAKAVSLLGMLDPAIVDAVRRAVFATAELVARLSSAHGGVRTVDDNLLTRIFASPDKAVCSATFHRSSRKDDPQLHGHICLPALVFSATRGLWLAADVSALFRYVWLIEQYFHAQVAAGLIKLGYSLVALRFENYVAWVPRGVSAELVARFSKRTTDIETRLAYFEKRRAHLHDKESQSETLSPAETRELTKLGRPQHKLNKSATFGTRPRKSTKSTARRTNEFFQQLTPAERSELEAAATPKPPVVAAPGEAINEAIQQVSRQLKGASNWLVRTDELLILLLQANPLIALEGDFSAQLKNPSGLVHCCPGGWTTVSRANTLKHLGHELIGRPVVLTGYVNEISNVPLLKAGAMGLFLSGDCADPSGARFIGDLQILLARIRRNRPLFVGRPLPYPELRPIQKILPMPPIAEYGLISSKIRDAGHIEVMPGDGDDLKSLSSILRDASRSATVLIWLNSFNPCLHQFFAACEGLKIVGMVDSRKNRLLEHSAIGNHMHPIQTTDFIDSMEKFSRLTFANSSIDRQAQLVAAATRLRSVGESFVIMTADEQRANSLRAAIDHVLAANGERGDTKSVELLRPIGATLLDLPRSAKEQFVAISRQHLPEIPSGTLVVIEDYTPDHCVAIWQNQKIKIPRCLYGRLRPFTRWTAELAKGDWLRPVRLLYSKIGKRRKRKRLDCRRLYRVKGIEGDSIILVGMGAVPARQLPMEPTLVVVAPPHGLLPKLSVSNVVLDLTAEEIVQRGGFEFLRRIFEMANLSCRIVCDNKPLLVRALSGLVSPALNPMPPRLPVPLKPGIRTEASQPEVAFP